MAQGAEDPLGIISGDFVFVGDLGRPDLLESAVGEDGASRPSAEELASSAKEFLALPDYLQVWPAHGSGSACGKTLGAVPQSTVGYERRNNRVLGMATDREAFITEILDGQPEPPEYFSRMKVQNRDGVPLLQEIPRPRACSPEDVDADMRVVDLRSWEEFRNGHLPGAIWSKLGNGLLMSVGTYIQPEERIAIVASAEHHDRIIRNLLRIGLDRVECTIDPALITGGDNAPEVSSEEFKALLESDPSIHVLDVRRQSEWALAHVEGSTNIAHTRLIDRIDEVPTDVRLYVHCAGGTRSGMAASELRRRGYDALNIAGGMGAMRKSGIETCSKERVC